MSKGFSCLLCQAKDADSLGERDGYKIVECEACQLRQVANLPDDAALDRYYANWHMNDKYARQARKKVWRWLGKLIRARLRLGTGRFLDVGCNAGFACEAARHLGFAATGIEVSSDTISAARRIFPNCSFAQQSVQDHAKSGALYDLVLCSEVIEHLNEVHGFLDALGQLVRPGGLLILTTPDGDAYPEAAGFVAWKDANPPQHLVWFRRKHLLEQMGQRGFTLAWQQKTRKPSLRLVFRKSGQTKAANQ
ncbi:MAG: hypothetical protein COA47_17080 [Robiginitomaculum sp.]|nr:MAG: hypothetical protein COA47_17080 [Robiginitomaculum sp.]